MAVNRKRFITRSEYAEENKRLSKINKVGKYLNLYIVVVAVLTVVILALTIAMSGSEEVAPTKTIEPAEDGITNVPVTEEPDKGEALVEEATGEDHIVTVTDDPVVQEIHTNEAWAVHPTEQTGPHTSTFQKGHIDYEEKLAAIFSVTDLVQEESFVKSVRNNGSASSAIAVVTSKDGTEMYRVSIEWIEGAGWKPVKLEVLKTLEGAY